VDSPKSSNIVANSKGYFTLAVIVLLPSLWHVKYSNGSCP